MMNGPVLILIVCAVHFGLSVSFSIQKWNESSRTGRPALDATLREQLGDSLLAAFVVAAVVLVEPVRFRAAAGIGLALVMSVLMLRLFRRLRRAASLGQ